MGTPVAVVYPTNELPTDQNQLKSLLGSLADTAVDKFFEGKPDAAAKWVLKRACLVLGGGAIARALGGLTPLRWVLSGFGALPREYVTYRALPVIQYGPGGVQGLAYRGAAEFIGGNGTRILVASSLASRLALVARVVATRFVLVAMAFEGGWRVGTFINEEMLEDDTRMMIGGTLNQIINEGGWNIFGRIHEEVDLSEM
jgi:hypothetical protein